MLPIPVFRVEKNANYTTMSNYHLRDSTISFKAKGILSMFLSLPKDWSYSVSGLAAIAKEGKDGILSGLKELEAAGYLERSEVGWATANMSSMKSRVMSDQFRQLQNRICLNWKSLFWRNQFWIIQCRVFLCGRSLCRILLCRKNLRRKSPHKEIQNKKGQI